MVLIRPELATLPVSGKVSVGAKGRFSPAVATHFRARFDNINIGNSSDQ